MTRSCSHIPTNGEAGVALVETEVLDTDLSGIANDAAKRNQQTSLHQQHKTRALPSCSVLDDDVIRAAGLLLRSGLL